MTQLRITNRGPRALYIETTYGRSVFCRPGTAVVCDAWAIHHGSGPAVYSVEPAEATAEAATGAKRPAPEDRPADAGASGRRPNGERQ
jgi:hypothetical protein